MRSPTTVAVLQRFMRELGRTTRSPANVYFTGGVTAILYGWRASTIDIDLVADPPDDDVIRAAAALKDSLDVNVEVAAPHHFIPEVPGWRERSVFIAREGSVTFLHYDPYAQALAKLERAHDVDLDDVRAMIDAGIVERGRLRELYELIEPELDRYPAVDPAAFGRRVEAAVVQ